MERYANTKPSEHSRTGATAAWPRTRSTNATTLAPAVSDAFQSKMIAFDTTRRRGPRRRVPERVAHAGSHLKGRAEPAVTGDETRNSPTLCRNSTNAYSIAAPDAPSAISAPKERETQTAKPRNVRPMMSTRKRTGPDRTGARELRRLEKRNVTARGVAAAERSQQLCGNVVEHVRRRESRAVPLRHQRTDAADELADAERNR
jgi:hypothetical protein